MEAVAVVHRSPSHTQHALLSPWCFIHVPDQHWDGQWQRLTGINGPRHFVFLVEPCLSHSRSFLMDINMWCKDLASLVPTPVCHPHA